jgi:precorrin-6A synthase
MKHIKIIGIGAGDPDYLTLQAVNALNAVDVFFLLDKGADKETLVDFRREICRRHVKDRPHRFVDATSPDWDRASDAYRATIDGLNRDKRAVFERLIGEAMADGECGGFLVWGDPALYDSTIRIVSEIAASGAHDIAFEVIPGISAAQALTARHKTPLNRIGGAVQITTGRRLAEAFPEDVDSVVVMLDARTAFTHYVDQDLEIFWGAYLGTPDELLISGTLADVADDITRTRAEAREKHGWIMDTYLLRRREPEEG